MGRLMREPDAKQEASMSADDMTGTDHGGHQSMRSGTDAGRDHLEMTRKMREPWLWTNATVALLGIWLMSGPFTFGYTRPALRSSDVVSGVLLTAFSMLAFRPRWDFVGRWTVAFVGLWLHFAPLVFWARSPAAYLN